MHTIYRKTPLGVAEVETRALKIPQRLRSLLIMIDGKRNAAMLSAMARAEESLAELEAHGLIEVAAAAAAAAPPAPAPAASGATFEALRKGIVRALNDALGPAAETLAIKLERCRTLQELQALLPQVQQTVSAMRGRAFAEAFAARFADAGDAR